MLSLKEIKKSEKVFSDLRKRNELARYAMTLFETSVSRDAILRALVKQGMTEIEAAEILKEVSDRKKKEDRFNGVRKIKWGIILYVIGSVIHIYIPLRLEGYLIIGGFVLFMVGIIQYLYSRRRSI